MSPSMSKPAPCFSPVSDEVNDFIQTTYLIPSNKLDDGQVQEGPQGFYSPSCLIQHDKQVRTGKNSAKLKLGLKY